MHRFMQRGRTSKTSEKSSKKKRKENKLHAIGALVPAVATANHQSDDVNNNSKKGKEKKTRKVAKSTLKEPKVDSEVKSPKYDGYDAASEIYDEVPEEDPYEIPEQMRPSGAKDLYETPQLKGLLHDRKQPENDSAELYSHLTSDMVKITIPQYDTLQRDFSEGPSEAIYELCPPMDRFRSVNDSSNSVDDSEAASCYEITPIGRPLYDDVELLHDELIRHKESSANDVTIDSAKTPAKKKDVFDAKERYAVPRVIIKEAEEEILASDKSQNLTFAEAMKFFKTTSTPVRKKENPQRGESFRKRAEILRRESGRITKLRTHANRPTVDEKHGMNTRIERYNANPQSSSPMLARRKELGPPPSPASPQAPRSPLNTRKCKPGTSALSNTPRTPTNINESELAKSPLFKTMQEKLNSLS